MQRRACRFRNLRCFSAAVLLPQPELWSLLLQLKLLMLLLSNCDDPLWCQGRSRCCGEVCSAAASVSSLAEAKTWVSPSSCNTHRRFVGRAAPAICCHFGGRRAAAARRAAALRACARARLAAAPHYVTPCVTHALCHTVQRLMLLLLSLSTHGPSCC
jgi:hypothetical protein